MKFHKACDICDSDGDCALQEYDDVETCESVKEYDKKVRRENYCNNECRFRKNCKKDRRTKFLRLWTDCKNYNGGSK